MPRNSLVILAASAAFLAGCADYMNRRDSITLGAGNANQANIGIHTVDPFPPAAQDTDIDIAGAKTGQAIERYVAPCDPDVVICTPQGGPAAAQ